MPHLQSSTIDLHMHSDFSDGELSPAELVLAASDAGIHRLALTDHDSIAGLELAYSAGQALGIEIISGVEISSQWRGMDIHIVGLGIDPENPELLARLWQQMDRRQARARRMGEKLAKLGFSDLYQYAAEISGGAAPARPHFAQALVANGYCKDTKQAFRRYLAVAKPAFVKTDWPDISTVTQWILEAGGVAVLAHPGGYKLTATKLQCLVADFAAAGGQALEVAAAAHTKDQVRQQADLAARFGLYASQGSDYHGPSRRWVQLGRMPALPSRCTSVNSILSPL